ncbi:hypothetical protein [Streptomyces sp. UNOC14_S4]|uniref:hypothetical protein n=1 Tax=Streptomyces sp. UNOC14_S4 TaxID=2872340 RepID=UPI001E5E5072|nr:hypothetical protein [Streptomyces sp. UNOC14_S4]MCC3767725.1 hypothetical protein [Streptomyces sp. UNOC14_S4]
MQQTAERRKAIGRRIFGYAFVTNKAGHPLMVIGPDGHLALPGGETVGDEPAVRPAAYHLRRLGLDVRPGPLLLVDHTEAHPLGAPAGAVTFVFHCGTLTTPQERSVAVPARDPSLRGITFVNPNHWYGDMTRSQQRRFNSALESLTTGTIIGCPYLWNGIRADRASAPAGLPH